MNVTAMLRPRRLLLFAALLILLVGPAAADVLHVEVDSQAVVLEGRSFGEDGAYEVLWGRITFGVDPANPMNARIENGFLLPDDRARVLDRAAQAWDWVHASEG